MKMQKIMLNWGYARYLVTTWYPTLFQISGKTICGLYFIFFSSALGVINQWPIFVFYTKCQHQMFVLHRFAVNQLIYQWHFLGGDKR